MPLAVAAVALTAGLAVATFVKAFGIGFLARPRSPEAARATESPPSMLTGMAIAAAACVGLALLPTLVLPTIGTVAGATVGSTDPVQVDGMTIRLVGVAGSLSPLMLTIALVIGLAGARPDRTPTVRTGTGRVRGVGPGRSGAGSGQRAPLPRVRLLRVVRAADPVGGDPVTALGAVGMVLQLLVVVALSPLLTGMMRQLRARMEGRAGPGIGQPWRDLRKLMRKRPVAPHGTTEVFRVAPLVLVATCLVVAAAAPFVTTASLLDPVADLFAVVALLTLGTVALALAGIDTGTAFGGMGASREATIIALVEPTLLVAIFALSVPVGSTNLGAIVTSTLSDPAQVFSPASLLAAVALIVVIIAETGRLPVDNPSTHLELTMVHEAMVLEYSGPDLAMVELASSMRLTVFLGLLANLFVPWGIATTGQPLLIAAAVLAFVAKVAMLGALLAVGEVFLAKLRLFRVPELLAGSFVLGLLAVGASFFLA
jgi:formate hydrogenlyase subunit 4